MTTYATFTEDNGWEGETWRFYVPVEGNEHALHELQDLLDGLDDDSFELDLNPISEEWVASRVALDEGSYIAAHTRLEGKLVLPEIGVEDHEGLYKGGIATWIK
jgi:hypothetical protein